MTEILENAEYLRELLDKGGGYTLKTVLRCDHEKALGLAVDFQEKYGKTLDAHHLSPLVRGIRRFQAFNAATKLAVTYTRRADGNSHLYEYELAAGLVERNYLTESWIVAQHIIDGNFEVAE